MQAPQGTGTEGRVKQPEEQVEMERRAAEAVVRCQPAGPFGNMMTASRENGRREKTSVAIIRKAVRCFCDYGLRIKKASRHPTTWVVSLANEWIGYVPTAQAFVGGGYEPRTARSSKLAPDAGQRLLETALKALGRVKPQEK